MNTLLQPRKFLTASWMRGNFLYSYFFLLALTFCFGHGSVWGQSTIFNETFESSTGTWTGSTTPSADSNWWAMATSTSNSKSGWYTVGGVSACTDCSSNGLLNGSWSPRIINVDKNGSNIDPYCTQNSVVPTSTSNRRLYSPQIDASSYSNLTLSFKYVFGAGSGNSVSLQYSTDATTWTTIETYSTAVTSSTTQTVSLPCNLNNTTFYLAWNYNSSTTSACPSFV